jgi:hypothetical protein
VKGIGRQLRLLEDGEEGVFFLGREVIDDEPAEIAHGRRTTDQSGNGLDVVGGWPADELERS